MHDMQVSPVLLDRKHLHRVLQTLDEAERLYVESRCAGTPPYAAARTAGFKEPRTKCTELEADERIIAAIRFTVRSQAHQLRLTREHVLAGFMDAVNTAATATELVAAWREVGKLIGAYEPSKLDVNIRKKEDIAQMSDAALVRLAGEEAEYDVLDFEEGEDGTYAMSEAREA